MKRELKVSFALPAEEDERNHSLNRTASQQYNLSFTGPRHSPGIPIQHLVTPRSPLYPENIIPQEDRVKAAPSSDTVASHEPAPESNHDPVEPSEASAKKDESAAPEVDLANGAILIYPKKIDNLRRFRILFVGILLFISSSTQGVHSLFGTLYLQVLFRYDFRKMAIVYVCGQAFGMFVFPFGMLYDWFGPRVVVASATVIAALGHLLFALAFGGHIEATVSNCAIFYSIMCWGCYAIDVTVLPAVLTHMPRDRGQPTGMLETFSGLGSSFFSCLFRGFFGNNFEHLMWFLFAFTLFAGVIGTWYLEDAPYVVNRWEQRRITPREQLRRYLIRNRYMSQLVPQRRYMLMTLILIILNFYLTIQAVVVSYLASEMTDGKKRGIAIGSIVIVLLVLILIVPTNAIDGPTEQDKQVIEAAKEKEDELRNMQEERYRQRHLKARAARQQQQQQQQRLAAEKSANPTHEPAEEVKDSEVFRVGYDASDTRTSTLKHDPLSLSSRSSASSNRDDVDVQDGIENASPIEVRVPPSKANNAGSPLSRSHRGGLLSNTVGLPFYEPEAPERPLLNVYIDDDEEDEKEGDDEKQKRHSRDTKKGEKRANEEDRQSPRKKDTRVPPTAGANTSAETERSRSYNQSQPQAHTNAEASPTSAPPPPPPPRQMSQTYDGHHHTGGGAGGSTTHRQLSFTVRVDTAASTSLHGSLTQTRSPLADSRQVEFKRAPPSTYDNPRVEVITLCGEVFVPPVYQTTFWESLTYLDMWMIAYTTLCVWGVGLTMTGNWNIYIMLLARYGGMEQKHYILFAAMAGVSTAGGRVFLGMYERILSIIRERTGVAVVPTILYPLTSIGLLLGMIFWIALPGDKVLVLAYLIGPAFYGISSSITPYVLGTIFDRDLGMHYGFCFFAGAIGFVLCFWCSWYLTYKEQVSLTPLGYFCIGQRRCMNRAVGIYVALVFSSIISSYIVHRRYAKLVKGKLAHRRVIVPRIKKIFETCGCCDEAAGEVKTAQKEKEISTPKESKH